MDMSDEEEPPKALGESDATATDCLFPPSPLDSSTSTPPLPHPPDVPGPSDTFSTTDVLQSLTSHMQKASGIASGSKDKGKVKPASQASSGALHPPSVASSSSSSAHKYPRDIAPEISSKLSKSSCEILANKFQQCLILSWVVFQKIICGQDVCICIMLLGVNDLPHCLSAPISSDTIPQVLPARGPILIASDHERLLHRMIINTQFGYKCQKHHLPPWNHCLPLLKKTVLASSVEMWLASSIDISLFPSIEALLFPSIEVLLSPSVGKNQAHAHL
ncbi:hypothetical protein EDC04DRAFT_2904830 [Pisolithus marmoratus]|nr:hypothetical protein EDC04DRAFT_2904830 [Pisolithus marmoratus]